LKPTKKSSLSPENSGEDVEVVEGELMEAGPGTAVETAGTAKPVPVKPVEIVAAIGTAAVGMYRIFKMISGRNRFPETPRGMQRRRRRRRK